MKYTKNFKKTRNKYNPKNLISKKKQIKSNRHTRHTIHTPKQLEQIPDYFNKHLLNYEYLGKKNVLAFSLKPYLHGKSKLIILGNQINNLKELIKMPIIKEKFKTMFSYDYMNYLDMDIDKRRISISTSYHLFHGQPIILEGYLVITFFKHIYDSYMLDKLKILDSSFKNSSFKNSSIEYYFPESLPDNFSHSYLQSIKGIMEIFNQIFTIMKYISIMISYSDITKPFNIENAFEIIKVQFKLFSDNSVILERCEIKKDWEVNNIPNTQNKIGNKIENKLIGEWLDGLIFRPIFGGKLSLDMELASFSIFERNYNQKKQPINRYLTADNMVRKDFNNKFIIISSDFITVKNTDLQYKCLIKYLTKYNLTIGDLYSTPGSKSAFIWYGYDEPSRSGYDIVLQHYNTLAYVGNAIDSTDNINEKQQLFFLLKKLYPNEYLNFLADSFLLTKKTEYKTGSGDIFIARPITEINPETKQKKLKAAAGRDIIIISNTKTMNQAKELLERYDNVLISQYIQNPLLFKGKKFHLRIYFLITWFGSTIKTYLFDNAFILTAKLPFILDHFDDKDIHDTHFKSTEGAPNFPKDFTTENMGKIINKEVINKLWLEIREIMRKVSTLLLEGSTRIKKFPNLKNAFQVEGCDIMITEDFRPILLECNNKAGFSNKTIMSDDIQRNFFDFIDRNVLAPVYGNGDHKTDEPLFISKI
jgi:hypothetical protein